MSYSNIVPYTSVFIDATWKDFFQSASWCLKPPTNRDQLLSDIRDLFSSESNPNSVLPCLSVRTGLDLFFRARRFPPGSEVVMSAVNIPAMVQVVHSNGLEVVALDVDMTTMRPKLELLESLVTSKTKVLLVANIYGRGFDMEPFVRAAKRYGLAVVEDWAEGFSGLGYLGHPESDLSLFSFGPIKYYTAFGGAIAKVNDENLYYRMKSLYETDPMQSHFDYLNRLMKLSIVYALLNCPSVVRPGLYVSRKLDVDIKNRVVGMLRSFPNQMLARARQQPCNALLGMLKTRLSRFDAEDFDVANVKAEYALRGLPARVYPVGRDAEVRNHWLFPVVVKNPCKVIESLNSHGVDAYRGATQLSVVKSDRPWPRVRPPLKTDATSRRRDGGELDDTGRRGAIGERFLSDETTEIEKGLHRNDESDRSETFPELPELHGGLPAISSAPGESAEAEFLIDHVIYLPINKTIPFAEIDKVCRALRRAVESEDDVVPSTTSTAGLLDGLSPLWSSTSTTLPLLKSKL